MTQAILFDLDGTLADTAPDLTHALNQLLQEHALPSLPLETVRPYAGLGSALVTWGFGIDSSHALYPELRSRWLDYYEKTDYNQTTLFPGIVTLLDALDAQQIPWGIVTNKISRFTLPLLEKLAILSRAKCIICGDTLAYTKPHPAPIQEACRLINYLPASCLYLGDSEMDVVASKAAGLKSIVALYGYILPNIEPKKWQADGYIQAVNEVSQWIK